MFMQSGKIVLRALEPSDVDILYAWENNTSEWEFGNTLAPFSRFQIEEYVLNSQYDLMSARQLRLMIDLEADTPERKTIGAVDLFDYDPVNRRAGIGILIAMEYRNQGYASSVIGLITEYAREMLHLHQLYCNIAEDNKSSLTLFEKAGFVRCAEKKEWISTRTGWKDEYMYQLILDILSDRA
jgi:diamine N-acetyltransferase